MGEYGSVLYFVGGEQVKVTEDYETIKQRIYKNPY